MESVPPGETSSCNTWEKDYLLMIETAIKESEQVDTEGKKYVTRKELERRVIKSHNTLSAVFKPIHGKRAPGGGFFIRFKDKEQFACVSITEERPDMSVVRQGPKSKLVSKLEEENEMLKAQVAALKSELEGLKEEKKIWESQKTEMWKNSELERMEMLKTVCKTTDKVCEYAEFIIASKAHPPTPLPPPPPPPHGENVFNWQVE